ncbi:MAG: hypothetical protein GX596_00715 [Propionibacterium sp.]|nr:hypothetical protein [Propionibacterium sp.]
MIEMFAVVVTAILGVSVVTAGLAIVTARAANGVKAAVAARSSDNHRADDAELALSVRGA